jgi:hypothetical protein
MGVAIVAVILIILIILGFTYLLFALGPWVIIYALIFLAPLLLLKVNGLSIIARFLFKPVIRVAWSGTVWFIVANYLISDVHGRYLFLGMLISILVGMVPVSRKIKKKLYGEEQNTSSDGSLTVKHKE